MNYEMANEANEHNKASPVGLTVFFFEFSSICLVCNTFLLPHGKLSYGYNHRVFIDETGYYISFTTW